MGGWDALLDGRTGGAVGICLQEAGIWLGGPWNRSLILILDRSVILKCFQKFFSGSEAKLFDVVFLVNLCADACYFQHVLLLGQFLRQPVYMLGQSPLENAPDRLYCA